MYRENLSCSKCDCFKAYWAFKFSCEVMSGVKIHEIEGIQCDACGNIDPVIPRISALCEKIRRLPEVTNWFWDNDSKEWNSFKKGV